MSAPSGTAAPVSVTVWGELRGERKLPGSPLRVLMADQAAGGVERVGDADRVDAFDGGHRCYRAGRVADVVDGPGLLEAGVVDGCVPHTVHQPAGCGLRPQGGVSDQAAASALAGAGLAMPIFGASCLADEVPSDPK